MSDSLHSLREMITGAFRKRSALFDDPETTAYRLFNGFCEGCADLSIDRYGTTAVILRTKKQTAPGRVLLTMLCGLCLEPVPGIDSVLYKDRYSGDMAEKKGVLLSGSGPARSILEWGVEYPIDLQLNKDCGFYLDSALLRRWLLEHAGGKRVLNTFAYTGSARHSDEEYLFGDFFHVAASLRRSGRLFDLILLDPPFFANAGRSAKVDQARNAAGLINKIRPLAAHQGKIIVLNNALFLSGKDFLSQIETICGDCLSIAEIIPVPGSFYGFSPVSPDRFPADPAPFDHPTKIIVLDVRRKDERA